MSTQNDLIRNTVHSSMFLGGANHPEKELTIADLWRVLLRRRTTAMVTFLCFVAAGVLACVVWPRRYEATAQLQVQKEVASPLGLAGEDSNSSFSDALEDNMTLQTQAGILQSDSLALSVIKSLNLESNSDFKPKFSLSGWLLGFISPAGPPDPRSASLEDSPRRRTRALLVFQSRLTVKPVAGTRLINVSYLNPDPAVSAQVANSISQELVEYNFQMRHSATSRTAQWLSGQLSDLRRQSEDLEAKVAQAQHESGVLSLGGVDSQGREQLYSNVLDKLQQATSAYLQAESSRILKQATYEVAKTGDVEAISELAGNATFAGMSGMAATLTLIQSLRMQEAETRSQIDALSAKFGPAYPKLIEMHSQLNGTEDAIKDEVNRITERAKNDYDVARQVEDSARGVYTEQKQQADALNDKAIAYTILRQEADQSRALYEGLFRQMKEAGVLADFHANNIAIVDPARVPAKPAQPKVLLFMLASVGGGMLFGFCGALVRDGMDRKIHGLSELDASLQDSVFALLPHHKMPGRQLRWVSTQGIPSNRTMLPEGVRSEGRRATQKAAARAAAEFPALRATRSCYVESLRSLRTALMLSRSGSAPQVILVTSSVSGEGKSMLSLNLAALLALQQKQILLIDADLRKPRLHHRLSIDGSQGLSSFLAGQTKGGDGVSVIVPSEEVPGLHILPAGPIPPHPAELLGSEQMRRGFEAWRRHFDFIIIDGPPVLPVTDSVILSSMSDFTLLLARFNMTERNALERSYHMLQVRTSSNRVGIVLNAIHDSDNMYYKASGYDMAQEQSV